ncbi:MAG: adenylate/guanylate cyclase domain-containing protein [Thermoleophilaceae bacterium]
MIDQPDVELVRRLRIRLTWLGWLGGAAGALVVFTSVGFLIPIFLEVEDREELGLLNGPLVAVYVLISGMLLMTHLNSRLERTLAWVVEGRAPDEREHRETLRLAVHGVKLYALAWLVGAVLFSALNGFAHSWAFAAVVAGAIWLGGETTCALDYLITERVLRPVTARALAARQPERTVAPGVRGRLVMAWLLGTGVPLLGVLVVGIVGLSKPSVETEYLAAAIVFLGAVAAGAGLFATLFAAKAIADPVTSVRDGLERVKRGELEARVPVDDGSEVGLLQAGFNRMAEGLCERERIRDLFGRQVGEEVARAALRDGTRLGGEEREVGALFVDLVGSTSMAMAMPPTEVVRLLNRYFRIVVEVSEREGGLVNKFEGDAALCVFGAPVARADPAGDALRCARRLAARLSSDVPEVDFGIGVSAGRAVAGNVGAEHRFEYTVIGDPVNEAARLSTLAKQRPERVLASKAALARAADAESAAWSVTESALLRGRDAPTGLAHPLA